MQLIAATHKVQMVLYAPAPADLSIDHALEVIDGRPVYPSGPPDTAKIVSGVVLLDWSDFTEGEPDWDRQGPIEKVLAIRSDYAQFIPRRNRSHTLSFRRVKKFASPQGARNFRLLHMAALQFDQAQDCVIDLDSSAKPQSVTLRGAVLTESGFKARIESNLFIADYQIVGGELANVSTNMIAATDYIPLAIVGAGNTDVESDPDIVSLNIQAAAGSYSSTVSLLAGSNKGALRNVYIEAAAGTQSVSVRSLTSGGTEIELVTATAGGTTKTSGILVWNGAAWEKFGPWNTVVV